MVKLRTFINITAFISAFVIAQNGLADSVSIGDYTWTYSVSSGKATITGVSPATGDISIPATIGDYSVRFIGARAFEDCSGLTSVMIPDGVTSIGRYAFRGCSGLTSVEIPDGVTSIGYSAFSYCSRMASVMIPSSMKTIASHAFEHCSGLTAVYITDVAKWCEISFGSSWSNPLHYAHDLYLNGELVKDLNIPDGVTSIGRDAFKGCIGLTSVMIPDSVTNIGEGAFSDCSGLTAVYIADIDKWREISFGDFLSNPLRYAHNLYLNGELVKDLKIPDGVTIIGDFTFEGCSGLTSVEIPDGVTSIGRAAFSGCSGLTSVKMPNAVTSIGELAFYGCSGLTNVTISDSVKSIEYSTFSGCSGLTNVEIPDGVTSIGAGAFSNCSNLNRVAIPDSVTSIESSAFSKCDASLFDTSTIYGVKLVDGWAVGTTVAISGELDLTNARGIGSYAFNNCSGLTNVILPSSATCIGSCAFEGCSGLTNITVPNNMIGIGREAFRGCTGLASVTIGNSVTSIGDDAFSGCSGLTSVTIPSSVTSIGERAFYGCNGIKNVIVPQYICSSGLSRVFPDTITNVAILDGVKIIGNFAFYGCRNLTEIIIPDSVEAIGDSAFEYCYCLKRITLGKGLSRIGRRAFYGCQQLEDVYITDLSAYIGIDYDTYASPLLYGAQLYLNDDLIREVVVPDGITSIGDYVFYGCDSITNVTIGSSVTSIGANAFSGCAITDLIVPDSVVTIGDGAFMCDSLRCVTIPQCLCDSEDGCQFETAFGEQSSYGNYGITNIIVSMGVTNIGRSAFSSCYSLKCVTIPSTVRNVGTEAFYSCRNLLRVYIDDLSAWCSIQFGDNDYYGSSYREGTNPLSYASDGLYLNNEKLSGELVIPDEVTNIGAYAFANCNGITSLTIPNTVTNIGSGAFSRCSSLESVTVPQYLCDDDIWSFRGRFYDVFSSNYSYGGTSITNLIIAEGVTNISERAFDAADSLRNLTSVTIPSTVKCIGRDAFPTSSRLRYINISDLAAWCAINFPDLFSNPFWFGSRGTLVLNGVPIQGNLEIPDGVTSIGDYAFAFLGNITSVTIPPSVTHIGTGGFYRTDQCTTVNISDLSAWCNIRFENLYSNPLYAGSGRLCLNGEELQGKLVIPDNVGVIGRAVFCNCDGLIGVTMPNGVTSIDDYAFFGCSGLTSVIFEWNAPEVGSNAFNGVADGCVARVLRAATGFEVDADGKWQGMRVVRYGEADETTPSIGGDANAIVEETTNGDFTIKPSEDKTDVEVTIPEGVSADKVTVQVTAKVEKVKANGATIQVMSGEHDVSEYVKLPEADLDGFVDLTEAVLKPEIVEALLVEDEAEVSIGGEEPLIRTAETKPGLTYHFREGTSLEAMRADTPLSKAGDGQAWEPTITVKDPDSAFYELKVTW